MSQGCQQHPTGARLVSAGNVCLSSYSNMTEVRLTGAQVKSYSHFVLAKMLLSASGLLSTFSPHSHEATIKQLSSQFLLLLSCPSEKNYEEKKQNICISEYSTNAQEILQQPLQAIIQMQSGTAPPLRQLSAQMLGTCLSTPAGSTVYWDIGTSGK